MIHSSGSSQAIKNRVEPHFPARNAVIIAKTIGDHDTQTFFGRANPGQRHRVAPRQTVAECRVGLLKRACEVVCQGALLRERRRSRKSAGRRPTAAARCPSTFESAIVRSASADRKPLERRSFSIRLSQMPADIPTHAPSPTRWHSTPIHRPPLTASRHRPDLDCAVR